MSLIDGAARGVSRVVDDGGREHFATVLDINLVRPTATVAVVGLGYVGLPTALSLVESGSHVIGLDTSPARLAAIAAAEVDLLPSDLERLYVQVGSPTLELTADAERLEVADTVVICVPTPVTKQQVPDLRALSSACASVVRYARPGQTLVLTSTTYVGCTRNLLEEPLRERGLEPGRDVYVAFSPERIDPGVQGHSPATTARVVGGRTQECARRAASALQRTCPVLHVVSSPETAELSKILENTFRAVNIALANEISDVAAHLGLSATEVIDAAATKPYGYMKFTPGPGVGGHCIPCDPHYLLWQLRGERVPAPLIEAAMTGIAMRPGKVVDRIRDLLADTGRPMLGAAVHLAGVAYKPGVADVRESPALEILRECVRAGARVSYTDPLVPELQLSEEVMLRSVAPPDVQADLVLAHTQHPDDSLDWIASHPVVLDATYRLDNVPHCKVV